MITLWQQQGRVYRYEGHDIFYREQGQGEALLCLHGFPTSSWDWHLLWPALAGRFRVVAPDMLGFGFSAKPRDHDYSVMEQARIIQELLGHLGIAAVHVLAHDVGDTVAQELLASHHERRGEGLDLRSVCFLNGGLFPETHHPRLIQRALLSPVGPLISRLSGYAGFRRSFSRIFGRETRPTEAELRDYWTGIAHQQGQRIMHRLIRYMIERRTHRERWVGVLSRTAVPLRLINGAADPVSGAHAAARYRELVPSADVVLLERIGHYPQVEAPDATLAAFLAFIERVQRLATAAGPPVRGG